MSSRPNKRVDLTGEEEEEDEVVLVDLTTLESEEEEEECFVDLTALEEEEDDGAAQAGGAEPRFQSLAECEAYAQRKIRKYGLDKEGWTFVFGRSRSRFGVCHHGLKRIEVSKGFALVGSKAEVKDTVLHEIAHALVGHEAGHGKVWQDMAKSVGCKWIGAKKDVPGFYKPRYVLACPKGCTYNYLTKGKVVKAVMDWNGDNELGLPKAGKGKREDPYGCTEHKLPLTLRPPTA